MKAKQLLGIKISLGSYRSFVDRLIEQAVEKKSSYICVANVHLLIEAHKSESYAKIINNADMVTPDGKPISWALRFLYGIKQDRVAGMDLLPDMLNEAERQKIPVAFYGGTQEMLDDTHKYTLKRYPNLQVTQLYSPPFRTLSNEE